MTKVNLEQLTKEIRTMSVRSKLYKTLKTELSSRGYWKNLPRHNGENLRPYAKLKSNGNKNLPE